jgi:hypothetical protein
VTRTTRPCDGAPRRHPKKTWAGTPMPRNPPPSICAANAPILFATGITRSLSRSLSSFLFILSLSLYFFPRPFLTKEKEKEKE